MKKKIKRKYYIIISMIIIFFLCFLLFNIYSKKINPKINNLSSVYLEKIIYNEINYSVENTLKNTNLDILDINQNDNKEIVFASYDMNKTYEILEKFSKDLKKRINNLTYPNNNILISYPIGIFSNNVLINNFGPQIHVKLDFENTILTNIYTKITNYGLNNALVEAYIKVNITGKVITPIDNKVTKIEYDALISSKIINGKIPSFYGDYLTSSSSLFDVSIK